MQDRSQPRQDTLNSALTKLQTLQLNLEQVRRVAVERKGVVHIEVHEAGKQRFFVYETNELHEIQAENDPKIPFLKKVREPDFAADHEIISYRPGRRIVLGPVSTGTGNILKAYKKHHAATAAAKYAIALSTCEPGGFDIPELMLTDTDNDYLLIAKRTGQAPGITANTVSIWTDIGFCLQRFQRSLVTDGLHEFMPAEELVVLDERARRFLLCMPALPRHWQEGREHLEETATNLSPADMGLAHRDLHDEQFIVSDNTISLLDFDLVCRADVALDAGNLLAHLKLRTLQARHGHENSALTDCSKAFLTGLGRQDEPGFVQRLLFYQASTYYRLALLYALRPRWAHLTEALIVEGENCLSTFDKSRLVL